MAESQQPQRVKLPAKPTPEEIAAFAEMMQGSSSSSSGDKGTILITGYWPPTNIEEPNGMLNSLLKKAQRW